jgi:hypothetical protein
MMPPVKAPSNWKDPDKIVAYERDARIKQAEEALKNPLASTIIDVCLINQDGTVMAPKIEEALNMMTCYPVVAGIGIFEGLSRLFLCSAIAETLEPEHWWAKLSPITKHPYLTTEGRKTILDPVETLVGSSASEWADPTKLAKLIGIASPALDNAQGRAMAAYMLMKRIHA